MRFFLRAMFAAAFLVVGMGVPFPAWANSVDGVPVVTRHQAVIDGRGRHYTAEAGRIAIRAVGTGVPHGYMFYTAYRMSSEDGKRPVMFIWNGGPGANSSMLHFNVAGPRLLQGDRLVDNPNSWLAVADLVFVDPVGTGFSRPAKSRYASEFYGTIGDVDSVTEFIRCWLIKHEDMDAPLFLAGESWGAGRAAHVAYALEKRGIAVNGIVLISGGFGLAKNYLSPVLRKALGVIDMATIAFYWHKTASGVGSSVKEVRGAVKDWVHNRYVPALARASKLPDAEKNDIVRELANRTGIPAHLISKKTLVITPAQFRTALLEAKDETLYLLDGRQINPPPGENLGTILAYFRETLNYKTDLPYLGMQGTSQSLKLGYAPDRDYPKPVNARWNYATAPMSPEQVKAAIQEAVAKGSGPPQLGPPLPGTEAAFALNLGMKIFVAVGIYDTYLQCARGEATEEALPDKLRTAVDFKCYAGGHAMYLGQTATRKELSRDIKDFVTRTLK